MGKYSIRTSKLEMDQVPDHGQTLDHLSCAKCAREPAGRERHNGPVTVHRNKNLLFLAISESNSVTSVFLVRFSIRLDV